MTVESLPAHALTAALIERWGEIGEASAEFSNPFLRPEFTLAVSRLRRNVEVGLLREGGEVVGFLPFERHAGCIARPVGGRLSDYQAVVTVGERAWSVRELMRGCGLRS